MKKAFSLVELLIVVAILGILAAIVVPEFQTYTQQAKEAAAKDNLRILRNAIELYATQHNGIPPGYPDGDTDNDPHYLMFVQQLVHYTTVNGQVSFTKGANYRFGPYLSAPPTNPFNNSEVVWVLVPGFHELPSEATGEYGWIFDPITRNIRLDWPGTDTNGVSYYDY